MNNFLYTAIKLFLHTAKFAMVFLLIFTGNVFGQTWQEAPIINSSNLRTFQKLIQSGKNSTVKALIFGDSQETCPQGLGDVYIPSFCYNIHQKYGNSPATSWPRMSDSFGGGSPYAEWLLRCSIAHPGATTSRISNSSILPGFSPIKTSTKSGNNINNNQIYGPLFFLQPRAHDLNPGCFFKDTNDFFDVSQGIYIDIIAATNASSGEVSLRCTLNPTRVPSYFSPLIANFSSSMNLEDTSVVYKKQTFGPVVYDTSKYFQLEISGTDNNKFTDVVSVSFRSVANSRGWALTDISVGGYRTESFLLNHSNSGIMLSTLTPDVIFITYGANDSAIVTPNKFYQDTINLIQWIRSHTNENTPIILMCDVYRITSNQTLSGYLDQYPYKYFLISQELPNVLSINSRKLTENIGWNSLGYSQYLIDGVHYTALGARTKAELEVNQLWESLSCFVDFNGDGFVDFFDFDEFVNSFVEGNINADYNIDGFVDFFDYDEFIFAFDFGC